MGISTYTPLFRLPGLGPLGLPAGPSISFDPALAAAFNAASRGGDAFTEAHAGASLGEITGTHRVRLAAASDGSGVGNIPSVGGGSGKNVPVLRFVGGKSDGQEVALKPGTEIVLGYDPGLDIVLPREQTSRRHAKISFSGPDAVIEDLGSTAGTYVNGKKIIQRTVLKAGDRILIGTTNLRFDMPSAASVASKASQVTIPPPPSPRTPTQHRMSGLIEVVPLPDLLQLFATSQKSGVLEIQSNEGIGRIYLRKGRIYFCAIEGSPDAHPRKAAFRLLRWTQGAYELNPPEENVVPQDKEMADSIDSILMNGMCEMDEINRLSLGPLKPGAKVAANLAGGKLRDLTPEELDVMQTVLAHGGSLESVLDHFPGSDLEALTGLVALLQKGLIAVG